MRIKIAISNYIHYMCKFTVLRLLSLIKHVVPSYPKIFYGHFIFFHTLSKPPPLPNDAMNDALKSHFDVFN